MIQAQRLPGVPPPPILEDPSILESYLEDASGAPPGRAAGLVRPASETEAAAFLRASRERGLKILPQAARSSLTGGAIPQGEAVLSVEGMSEIGAVVPCGSGARVEVGPGVRLDALQGELAPRGWYYPPVPTYRQAMLGGTVSTNAGGAATFKYGATRRWVHGLRVLLANGDLLTLERGQAVAARDGSFRIRLTDGRELSVPVPSHRLPRLKKISAGYHAADPLDLVDLFVGSEGTLGLITAVTVELIPMPSSVVTGWVFLSDPPEALRLAATLRAAAEQARGRGDARGPDVRAIEWLDEESLEILRRRGEARRRRIALSAEARAALLFEVELAEPVDDRGAEDLLAAFTDRRPEVPDHPLVRLFRILEEHSALERLVLAFPEDTRRQEALAGLREAVPQGVGELLAERRREEPGVEKVGGDLIVPPAELPGMIDSYVRGFVDRGLDYAIWGHLGDGNLHPNALPRSRDEVQRGFEALLEFAEEAAQRGGCPLSEHGVGRSAIKQRMLRNFLGDAAIERMRRIKEALDPEGRLAPGVLFPARPESASA